MEMNTLMQALVKDLAEQMRPMVGNMIREALTVARSYPDLGVLAHNLTSHQLALIAEHVVLTEQMRPTMTALIDDWMNDNLSEKLAQLNINQRADVDLTDLAQHLTGGQIEVMARHVNLADLAAELADSHSDDIAEHISLSDLASEINVTDLAGEIDIEDSIKSFFSDNRLTISF